MDSLNNIQQEVELAREQQRMNIPAKRILEKIQGIPSDIEKLQRRWFWELLQNASDYNDQVEVELELHTDKLVFKHNGKPFRPIDTENLIAPDSGKDNLELRTDDTIGQFGTGFISTHVLSSHITVRGLLKSELKEEYHKFEFTLDRSGFTDKEELKNGIKKASKELDKPGNLFLAKTRVSTISLLILLNPSNLNSLFMWDKSNSALWITSLLPLIKIRNSSTISLNFFCLDRNSSVYP